MPQPTVKDHRVVLDGVEIVFSWQGDRWSHAIHFPGAGDAATWRSVEGAREADGDAAWPASPVIAEVSPVAAARAVVGVGRAGKSHFSVSFTAKPADGFTAKPADESGPRILVECACRIQEHPGWLGSTYERSGSAGPPSSLVRIPATTHSGVDHSGVDHSGVDAPLPRTVTWSYVVGPTGPVAGKPPR